MKIGRWSTTAANNNNTPPDGWPEGQAPSTVNDCAREMMASIRTMLNDMSFIDLAHTPTQTSSTTFTLPSNVVSFYDIGRRVKCFDASTVYGTVISSSFTTNTGVTLRLDSGALTSSLSSIAVSVLSNSNRALPESVYRNQNTIINGAIDLWQRGISFSVSATSGRATADRFVFEMSATAIINITRFDRSASASNVPSLAQTGIYLNHSMGISVNTIDAAIGAGEFCIFRYTVEGFDWKDLAHKPMFLSFWVHSNLTGTYCVSLRNSGDDRSYVTEYTISAANTWEKKTFAIPEAPTTGTWDYSFGAGLKLGFALACGSTYQATANQWTSMNALATSNQTNFLASAGHSIRFSDFRFYEGQSEVPIQVRTFRQELEAARRYFQKSYDWGTSVGSALVNGYERKLAGTAFLLGDMVVRFVVPMRSAPTVSLYSYQNGTLGRASNYNGGSTFSADITASAINASTNVFQVQLGGNGDVNEQYLFHWAAENELL